MSDLDASEPNSDDASIRHPDGGGLLPLDDASSQEVSFEPLLDDTIDCLPGALERLPMGDGSAGSASQMSARGRYYYFTTTMSLDPRDLPSGTSSESFDVYAWDRRERQYIWLTRPASGTPWSPSRHGAELVGRTNDGRYLYVYSTALAPGVGSIVLKDLWRLDLFSGRAERMLVPGSELERYNRLTRRVTYVENGLAYWGQVTTFPGLPDASGSAPMDVIHDLRSGRSFVVGDDEFGRAVDERKLNLGWRLAGTAGSDLVLYEGRGRVRATGELKYSGWALDTRTGSVAAALAAHVAGYTTANPTTSHDGRWVAYVTSRPDADAGREALLTVEDRNAGSFQLLEVIGSVPAVTVPLISPRGQYLAFAAESSLGGRLPTTCRERCDMTFIVQLTREVSLERLPLGEDGELVGDGVGAVGWSSDERFLMLNSTYPLEGWPRDPLQLLYPYVYSVCGE